MRIERVPGLRRLPPLVRRVEPDVVLYNSWWGKFSDSPRAIFEELRRRDAPFRHVWVLDDPAMAPDGATAVRPGSGRHLAETGRAGYIVSNTTLRGYFRKKPATTYLQTWHGTPLKRLGYDIERPSFPGSDRFFKGLHREVSSWDCLLSPNRFSTELLRSAFHYEGEVVETGLPRNDVLFAPDRDRVRARVREELGIEDGQRAVLYAPTWRDDDAFSTELDLGLLDAALGAGHVVLIRAHSAVAHTVSLPELPSLRNVSDRDDIADLMLAADVLVTDYSSVMFDFAPTGKPMLFFTYDLERYRDELRGFYFDFVAEAPGPLLATTAELAEAVLDVDGVQERFRGAYDAFRERFCHLDDGHASARAVDAVFDQNSSVSAARG